MAENSDKARDFMKSARPNGSFSKSFIYFRLRAMHSLINLYRFERFVRYSERGVSPVLISVIFD